MSFLIRKSVKALLLNEKNELLLMCADDPKTTYVDGKYLGRFWFPVGGEIEKDESVEQAAIREIYEETGIKENEIELGPIVWFGEFDLILAGMPTHLVEKFIVAKTKQNKISFDNLEPYEQKVIKKAEWFSLEKIKNCKDLVYPVLLSQYLSDIICGKYSENPIEIDLGNKPEGL